MILVSLVILFCLLFTWWDLRKRSKRIEVHLGSIATTIGMEELKNYTTSYIEFFDKNKNRDLWLAQMAMRNALLRFPSNLKIFKKYMDYLLGEAKEENDPSYFEEASNILSAFAEYAPLDLFSEIKDYRDKITEQQDSVIKKIEVEIQEVNNKKINRLEQILNELAGVEAIAEAKINSLLEEAVQTEEELHIAGFTPDQEKLYEELRAEFGEVAETLAATLEREKHAEYNRQAVEQIKKTFDTFTANEKKFVKGKDLSVTELVKEFSKINPLYLTPETLTYFNHVYGYIFANVNDDNKANLTKTMNSAEKDIV